MRSKYKQGKYKLTKPSKYRGDPHNVVYRSSWEFKFMLFCESSVHVTEWGSEEIKIPYIRPDDGRVHRYVPDFYMKMNNEKYIIEVKPERETKEPVLKKKNDPKSKRNYLREVQKYLINRAKWAAADDFSKDRGLIFKIITERELKV